MRSLYGFIREQLSNRADSEHEQAMIRLLVLGAATAYAAAHVAGER